MNRKLALAIFIIGICAQIIFPTWRAQGQWQNDRTKEFATGNLRRALDRDYFGYIPEYHVFWGQPQVVQGSIGVGIGLRQTKDMHYLKSREMVIDWRVLIVQLIFYCISVGSLLYLLVINSAKTN